MNTTTQPPAPPKWAMELAEELRPISALIATSVARQKREQAGLLKIIMRHYDSSHHAAAQAETVALLENVLPILEGVYEKYRVNAYREIRNRVQAMLAQLKEGAP